MYQSGAPFTVNVPVDIARIGRGSSRASLVGDPSLPGSERTPEAWFNTSAFLPPGLMTPGQFGDSPRNVLIGPSFSRVDLSLSKNFALARRTRLQLRAEAFNLLNTVSFTGLNTTVRFDNAGNPTGGFGAVTSAAPGRSLGFGARITF
jgi:outer membrane receptor protein involved in Fe transport